MRTFPGGNSYFVLTALDDRDSRLEGLEAGADDFLSKPIDRLELRARLRTITRLDRYRKAQFRTSQDSADPGRIQRAYDETLRVGHEPWIYVIKKPKATAAVSQK